MKITFLGTGPSGGVEGEGKSKRTQSSLLIEHEENNILIDCTSDLKEQLGRENITSIDCLILSHGHSDAIGGINALRDYVMGKIPCYASRETRALIEGKVGSEILEFSEIEHGKEFTISSSGLGIIPFNVGHYEAFEADGEKFPTLGFRINGIVYAEDLESVPDESFKYLDDLDVLIVDCAINNLKVEDGKITPTDKGIRGHQNVSQALELITDYAPKKAILTQIGVSFPSYEDTQKLILDYWDTIREETDTVIEVAYDGMVLNLTSETDKGNKEEMGVDENVIKEIEDMTGNEFELMRQAFGSSGGKRYTSSKLVGLIPEHKVFVETHAGGAAVYFNKRPSEMEVLNDLDGNIANSYRFLKDATEDDVKFLRETIKPISRKRFVELRDEIYGNKETNWKGKVIEPTALGFSKFFLVNFYSFANNKDSYGLSTRQPAICDRLQALKERLKDTKIECMDAITCIEKYDSKDAFFYIDPPYPVTWKSPSYGYTYEDVENLVSTLKGIKGKFIMSGGRDEKVKAVLGGKDFKIKRIKTARYSDNRGINEVKKSDYEWIVSNFNVGKSKHYSLQDLDSGGSNKELYSIESKMEPVPDTETNIEGKEDKEGETKQVGTKQVEIKPIEEMMKGKLSRTDFNSFPGEINLVERIVCIGGSSVDQQDKEPGDIDLIVRLGDKDGLYDFLNRNIISELNKANRKSHAFCEIYGPAGSRLALYDLKLVKRSWTKIDVECTESLSLLDLVEDPLAEGNPIDIVSLDELKCEPMKPFIPMKPSKRFYRVGDIVSYMF